MYTHVKRLLICLTILLGVHAQADQPTVELCHSMYAAENYWGYDREQRLASCLALANEDKEH